MMTSRLFIALAVSVSCWLVPAFTFGQVSADDFLPPVEGGPTDIKQPDKVAIDGDVVVAVNAQDAINAAVDENVDELANGDTPEVGAKMVKFPSGLGFVATGVSTYRVMENPTATRLAKRKAYVIAFTTAKKNLAEILGGLSNEGEETIRESLVNINLPKEEMTNISTDSEESLKQAVDMMLRGFVIYQVTDDTTQNSVWVSIVTTPKTRGKFARPAPNALEAENLRDGLNQVIAEVRSGLVPPVGGRIITMRATGESAFVGFGSAIVASSTNNAVQLKQNLAALKIASMRAKDALCGLIIGDKTSWESSVAESMKDQVREFEALATDDPLARKDPAAVRKFDEARQAFVTRMETNDVYLSARRGVLPPGINTKTWFNADHTWGYAMSVYVPSLTSAAAGAGREMREATILQPINDRLRQPGATDASSGFTDEQRGDIKRPGKDVKPGPSGKIEPE